jgi:hypothetical protein
MLMKDNREVVRRALPRVLIVSFLLVLVGASLLATPTAAADVEVADDDGCPMACHGDHKCGPNAAWDPEDKECVPGPEPIECGRDPTVFNLTGGHWQRLFNEFCQPYSPYGDLEAKCHDKNCEECKAQVFSTLVCTYAP